MALHIGILDFLIFALYYFILKGILIFVNTETRRGGYEIPAAVSGLLS